MIRPRFAAFTLIELLVVITIIVTLLALLTPALDKAIYQAELAVCAARIDGTLTASLTYAVNNRRAYPKRSPSYAWDAIQLVNSYQPFDLRVPYRPYTSPEIFVDPLCGEIKLDEGSNHPTDIVIFANYQLYVGLPMLAGSSGIDRMGQRFGWTDTLTDPNNPALHRFSILSSDRNQFWDGGDHTSASHQDYEGTLPFFHLQNENPLGAPVVVGFETPFTSRITQSIWQAFGGVDHGPVDLNFGFENGSVKRYTRVEKNDERMAKVKDTGPDEYDNGDFVQLPKTP